MRASFHNRKNGFTLLLAVLISTLLLSIGLAILDLAIKELNLSSAGRESQFALYAADTGTECALYWDLQQRAFATTTPRAIFCAGNQVVDPNTGSPTTVGGPGSITSPTGGQSVFGINLAPQPYCAIVTLTKTFLPQQITTLESRGYNTCDTGNKRRVERGIRVSY